MLCESLIHLEHVNCINIKEFTKWSITTYVPSIGRILQIMLPDVAPKLFDNLEIRCISISMYTKIKIKPRISTITTSVLANSGTPVNFWSCGERLHNLVNPPPFFFTSLFSFFDLLTQRCMVYINSGKTENVQCLHV